MMLENRRLITLPMAVSSSATETMAAEAPSESVAPPKLPAPVEPTSWLELLMGSRSVTWLVNTRDTWFQQTLGALLVPNHFAVLSLGRSQPCRSIGPLVGAPGLTPDRHGLVPGTSADATASARRDRGQVRVTMPYRDIWPEFEWLEVLLLCKLAGFDPFAVAFIDRGVPHQIVIERLAAALSVVQ
jgi:hypothetical protein